MAQPARAGRTPRNYLRRTGITLPLALLMAVAVIHGLAWSVITAPLNGPDESAHAAYAQQLAETGSAPQRNEGSGTNSDGMFILMSSLNLRPILGNGQARPLWDFTADVSREADAANWTNSGGPNPAGNYPPLYYAAAAVAYKASPDRSLLGRLWAMRAIGALMFAAIVWLSWLITAELLAARWQRAFVAAVVAIQPKLGQMAGVINPDVMLTAISLGALLAGLRIARTGPTARRALALGLLSAAGVLCHARGLFLPPFAAVALLAGWVAHRPPFKQGFWQAALAGGTAGIGTIAALLWTRAHAAGAAFGADSPVAGFNLKQFVSHVWQFYLPRLDSMSPRVGPPFGYRQVWVESFFGQFGSLDVNYAIWIYSIAQIGMGVLIVSAALLAARRYERVLERWPVVVVSLAFSLSLMALLHLVSYQSLLTSVGDTGDPVITGRYLFPLLPLLAGVLAWVIGALPKRLPPLAAGATLAALAALLVASLGVTVERYFA